MCECTWRCDKINVPFYVYQLVPQTGYVILYLNQYHCKIMCQSTWSCEKGNFMYSKQPTLIFFLILADS